MRRESSGISEIEKWTIRFSRIVAFLGLVALLALAAVILANATMSWLFSAPIDGVRDWIKLIVAIAVAACVPSVLATRQNITIRFVGGLVRPRWNGVLELFGAVMTLAVLAGITWQLQDYVGELSETGETTENLGMPVAPWWQVVTALFFLSTLVQALVLVRSVHATVTGESVDLDPSAEPKSSGEDA